MSASTSDSLTATGSVTLTKALGESHVIAAISGTYGTVTFKFEGTMDGTNWAPLAAQLLSTGATVTGTISPADDAELIYAIAAPALIKVRATVTAIASGTATFTLVSGSWLLQPANPTASFTLGAATGTSCVVTAGLNTSGSTGAGLGYVTGAGGSVTQATDRTTGVTLSKLCGQVTTQATSLAALAIVSHTVTNTTVAATDSIIITKVSGDIDTHAWVSSVGSGSFVVSLINQHASAADTTAFVYNFAVIKSVTS